MASADPPPADAGTDEVAALAARIGIALPAECAAGVAHHMALLDRHWRNLRSFALPDG